MWYLSVDHGDNSMAIGRVVDIMVYEWWSIMLMPEREDVDTLIHSPLYPGGRVLVQSS